MEILERRQHLLDLGTTALPWFLSVGCLVGLVLAVYGVSGWSKRQRVADELEDIAREKGKTELRRMTDDERLSKAKSEAEATVADEEPAPGVIEGTAETPKRKAGAIPSPGELLRTRQLEYMRRAMEAELGFYLKLQELFGDRYSIEIGVEVAQGRQRQQFDVLATPKQDGEPQFAFELKYTKNLPKMARTLVTEAITQAAAGASLVAGSVVPVAALVYDGEASASQLAGVRAYAQHLAETFSNPPKVIVVSMLELEQMPPAELARHLGLE